MPHVGIFKFIKRIPIKQNQYNRQYPLALFSWLTYDLFLEPKRAKELERSVWQGFSILVRYEIFDPFCCPIGSIFGGIFHLHDWLILNGRLLDC